eukprot:3587779-Amphidinium_carterae.1
MSYAECLGKRKAPGGDSWNPRDADAAAEAAFYAGCIALCDGSSAKRARASRIEGDTPRARSLARGSHQTNPQS